MKSTGLLVVILSFSLFVNAQPKTSEAFYGINLSQTYTGSGHGSSYVMNTDVQKGRKSLEMGLVYEQTNKRISGGEVRYKIFLGKNASLDLNRISNETAFRPYLHYDCLYHSSVVETPDFVPSGSKKSSYPELPSSRGTVATMEHFTGFGMQVLLAGNLCVDGSVGMGAYIGSIDKYKTPDTIGIHYENHGFVLAFQLGFGYKFGV